MKRLRQFFLTNMPAIAGMFIFVFITSALTLRAIQICHGHLGYILDDPYISMAVSKNLAQHGIWALTPHEFSSPASSILWPCILSCAYFISGVHELTPFIIEVILSLILIWVLADIMKREGIGMFASLCIIPVTVIAISLPVLVLIGLEHILHSLIAIAFLYHSIRILSFQAVIDRREVLLLSLLAGSLTMSRYEGCALLLGVCLLFLYKKQTRIGVIVCLAGLVPISVFGLLSIWEGWHFLPNSILAKAHLPEGQQTLATLYHNLVEPAACQLSQSTTLFLLTKLSLLALIVSLILKKTYNLPSRFNVNFQVIAMNMVFLFMVATHCLFARLDSRYRAYLILTGIVVLICSINSLFQNTSSYRKSITNTGFIALGLLLAKPCWVAARTQMLEAPRATSNIYDQQYQMGLFIKRYYDHSTVALNDIGCVSYLTSAKIVDLAGLSSMEVLHLMRTSHLDAAAIDRICSQQGVQIALLYARWFDSLPPKWIRVGYLRISNNSVCSCAAVSIYAVNPAEAGQLVEHLKEFESSLPEGDAITIEPAYR